MKSDGLARSVILLATLLALPSNVWAQRLSYGAGEGTFHYQWSNMGAFGQGDTLVVRRVLINTAGSVTPVPVPICGIKLVTSVAVRALGGDCSAPTEVLSPGDSVWAENQSVIGHVVFRSAYFPVFVSDEAASAMQTIARRLQLHIEVGPKGDFAIGSCWFGREGEQLSRRTAPRFCRP